MSEQRVAIVTGASRGIGRAIAVRLAAQGTAVVVGHTGGAATETVDHVESGAAEVADHVERDAAEVVGRGESGAAEVVGRGESGAAEVVGRGESGAAEVVGRGESGAAEVVGRGDGGGAAEVAGRAAETAAEMAGRGGGSGAGAVGRGGAAAVVEQITGAGGRAIAVKADVADERQVAAMFERAEEAFGGVDVVVNSAGVMVLSTIADLDLAGLDRMHRTNIRGTFVVAREAARRLRTGGSVVTVSSSVVGLGFPTYGGYAASKGAVEAMTLILARELRGRDITVNAVAPGPTATDLFLDGKDQATIDRLAAQPPLERLGTPEDIAEVVAFLTSPSGHWINGQVIRANGGIV